MVTTRQLLNQEEEKLYKSLFKVYNRIQQDLDSASWSDIQAIYHKTTDDIIRSGVTTIYEISARKVVERDIHVPYFLTQQDLAEIKRLTQKYQDSFWLSLNREVTMRNQIGVKTKYDPVSLLLVREQDKIFRQGFISRISSSVHGEAAAVAVLSKARQVVAGNGVNNHNVKPTRPFSTAFRKAAVGSGAELVPHLTWRTADMACTDCAALEGTQYLLDDPATPIPSETTHPRCRCELVLEDAEMDDEEQFAEELFF